MAQKYNENKWNKVQANLLMKNSCLLLDNKRPEINLFWYIPPEWKTVYHKSHKDGKIYIFTIYMWGPVKWGGSPTIKAPLWQHLLGLFGNYRAIWEGYRLIFYLEVSSIVTVKWPEKIVRFGNVCELLFPDQIPEKKNKDVRHKGCFRNRNDVFQVRVGRIRIYLYLKR